jgi:anti-sigma factor (TIGR02949 family)
MSDTTLMSCEDALRLLAEYLDGELDQADGVEVERHLHACRGCYSRSEFERRLKRELAELRHSEVPASVEQRIRHLLGDIG